MPITGIPLLDKEIAPGTFGLIGCDSKIPLHAAARMLTTVGYGGWFQQPAAKTFLFLPGDTAANNTYNSIKKAGSARNGSFWMYASFDYTNYLHKYEEANPLGTTIGSLRRFNDMLANNWSGDGIQIIGFLFSQTQPETVWKEMKYLHIQYPKVAILCACMRDQKDPLPAMQASAAIDYVMEMELLQTNLRMKTSWSRRASGSPTGQWEEYELDAAGLTLQHAKNNVSQLGLSEVTGQLYDLRSYQQQNDPKNSGRIKELLARYKELSGTARPKFMN